MKNKGYDTSRKIISGISDISEELRDLHTSSLENVLLKAVVTIVLNDLSVRSEQQLKELRDRVLNSELLDSAPRNSIIVRIISNGQDKRDGAEILCYPLFPPHFCFPIKSGEQVWLLSEAIDTVSTLYHWLCRVPEPDYVDDLNFTHGDRKFETDGIPQLQKRNSNIIPGFINGLGDEDSTTLRGENDYEAIVTGSVSNKFCVMEPVPRYTKRPGDQVLQGSNNALICLGQDRWEKAQEGSNASTTPKKFSGAIDIVVGRGRFVPKTEDERPKLTEPKIIKNTRELFELDKNPASSLGVENKRFHPIEGDPDPKNDSSRIFVSMNSNVDDVFLSKSTPSGFNGSIPLKTNTPCAVIKSDEVRIIAREDKDKKIEGSVRIIREGSQGEDHASVLLLPGGNVQITAKRISLGDTADKNKLEPFVRGNEMETLFNNLVSQMKSFLDMVSNTLSTNQTPGFGGPNPAVVTIATAAKSFSQQLESQIKPNVSKIKSTVIMGE